MGRISKEQEKEVQEYANSRGEKVNYCAHHCNSIEEVKAVEMCLNIVEQGAVRYQHYKNDSASKHLDRNKKLYEEADKIKNPLKREDEFNYLFDVAPLKPKTQETKNGVRFLVNEVLEKAGIGEKRRKKMLPMIMEWLKEPIESSPEEEARLKKLLDSVDEIISGEK